ncbi:hypothetical protein B0J14DRAFT_606199 [Halenospora varia]|nr:hypothetical protein B0J14DRAFT_606199 [Halenospora varia]
MFPFLSLVGLLCEANTILYTRLFLLASSAVIATISSTSYLEQNPLPGYAVWHLSRHPRARFMNTPSPTYL